MRAELSSCHQNCCKLSLGKLVGHTHTAPSSQTTGLQAKFRNLQVSEKVACMTISCAFVTIPKTRCITVVVITKLDWEFFQFIN